MQHYNIVITGKVQGVFFRSTARRIANELGLTGFARNETDGSVYVEAEGDELQLKRFLDWCRKGPERAAVDKVVHNSADPVGYGSFEIRQ